MKACRLNHSPPPHRTRTRTRAGDLKKPGIKSDGFLFGLIGGGEADAGPDKYVTRVSL